MKFRLSAKIVDLRIPRRIRLLYLVDCQKCMLDVMSLSKILGKSHAYGSDCLSACEFRMSLIDSFASLLDSGMLLFGQK